MPASSYSYCDLSFGGISRFQAFSEASGSRRAIRNVRPTKVVPSRIARNSGWGSIILISGYV